MAGGTVNLAHHGTLAASTVDTVNLNGSYPVVEIINSQATAGTFIYVTVSYKTYNTGSPVAAATPTVAGADTYLVVGNYGHLLIESDPGGYIAQVKLISAGTPTYSVQCYKTRTR